MGKTKQARPAREPADHIHTRKNKYAAPVGGLFLFLAALGLAALCFVCVIFTRGLLDNSGEKERFEEILAPVVMFNPVPFDTPANADPLFLLQTSLWSALLGDKRESYEYDDMGAITVPAPDVDVACSRLFGDVKLEHQSFGDYETSYVYNANTKSYTATIASQTGIYTPSVARIVKKGDQFTLTVGYIPPSNIWTNGNKNKSEPQADKFVMYELLKVKDYYQIRAIRDPSVDELSAIENLLPEQQKAVVKAYRDSSSSQAAASSSQAS